MISLILPYWDRQAAADEAIALLDRWYLGQDIEVIVVDDGNIVPFRMPETRLDIRVIRLPVKSEPTSPLHAWNVGVKAARGDFIALSCIEILHDKGPVLAQMKEQLARIGEQGYVLAAAWCPDTDCWHCHSSVHIPDCPPGTGIGFLGMMRKSLFDRIGGFDEAYMAGAGYEDRDFIRTLDSSGVRFCIRDDLVVSHPKRGATIAWKPEGFVRNEALFRKKWAIEQVAPVTFLCLKAGDAYGPEYVNNLFDMVRRNLRAGYPGRFVCLTDDPNGLVPGVETMPLPGDLEGWWGKLYMFKHGLFSEGERVIFMDLDTLILGSLEPLVRYSGEFATLRDFYQPRQLGPAIISWRVGDFSASIWEEWDACGRPRNPGGDLWWLNSLEQGRFQRMVGILQDVLPGYFCSFKADCKPYPPNGTHVVCFHGQPKPHNCATEWVAEVWREGGSGMTELKAVCNTANEALVKNIRSACARDIPWLNIKPAHDRQAVIVAGGPSLLTTLPEIVWRKRLGQAVIAVNGAARWLNENGIIPDMHVIIDARPENAEFLSQSQSTEQFLASQCDPAIFDAAKSPTLFHMNTSGIERILPKDRVAHLVSSGTTVGLAAMAVAYVLGYRVIHLHGFDSSYETTHHAYTQASNDADSVVDVLVDGRKFKSAPWMVKQAQQFAELSRQLVEADVTITVAGDGLLPHIAKCMTKESQYECC